MIKSLRGKFSEIAPDWLYCTVAVLYWRLHPKRESILLLPRGNSWLLVFRDGSIIFRPKSSRLPFVEPYERYFKVAPGEIVLDVGACIGEFTVPAARRAGEVVAIEPNPENQWWLQRNIVENKLGNVHVIGKAAWSYRKALRLHLSKENIGGHSVIGERGGGNIVVQADTLDNIVSDLGIEKVDFVKMDIEGAEVQALEGAKKVLTTAKKIAMETHLGINNEKTTPKVQFILKNYGFDTWADPHGGPVDMVYGKR